MKKILYLSALLVAIGTVIFLLLPPKKTPMIKAIDERVKTADITKIIDISDIVKKFLENDNFLKILRRENFYLSNIDNNRLTFTHKSENNFSIVCETHKTVLIQMNENKPEKITGQARVICS